MFEGQIAAAHLPTLPPPQSYLLMVLRDREMANFDCAIGEKQLIETIFAIVLKGHWDGLLKPRIGWLVTSSTIHQVLLKLSIYSRGPSCSWSFFKWVESCASYKHSLQSSWTMIHILAKHRHFKSAHNLLEKISHRNFLSSPSVLNALVGTHYDPEANSQVLSWLLVIYANLKETQNAIQVFEHMKVHGLKPHLHACTVLLNSLVKDRLTDTVWKMYKKMVGVGVVPNIHIYNVLIHACCKSGDFVKAENLLTEMELKCVFPDLCTYNTLINLYIKRGMHFEASCVQDRMERGGVCPDIITYNSLIYGFCREGRMKEAVRLFREIRNATPNHITYTSLIDGYCRVNEIEEALRLLKVMEMKGLYPGVVTYNSILCKLCAEGRVRDANQIMNEMLDGRIEPDILTYNALINAYCKIKDMVSAMKLKKKMLDAELKPDKFTYKTLIHGFCKVQEIDNAKEVLFDMLSAGFSPAYCTYASILDCYSKQGREEEVVRLPNEFTRRNICVDVSVYRALIRRLCKKEKVDCAEKLFSHMKENGISGDSVVYTSLALAQFKAGNAIAISNILDDMCKRKLVINLKIYRCFNASYNGDSSTLGMFWHHMVESGLMSKAILKDRLITHL